MAGPDGADRDGFWVDIVAGGRRACAEIGAAPPRRPSLPAGGPHGENVGWGGEVAKDFYPPEFSRIERPKGRGGPRQAEAQAQQMQQLIEEAAAAQRHENRRNNE